MNNELEELRLAADDWLSQWAADEIDRLRDALSDAENLISEWKPHMYCEHGRLRTYECEECEAKAQPVAVPEGYALVPKEPTRDMVLAGHKAAAGIVGGLCDIYRAMLAASQPAQRDGE